MMKSTFSMSWNETSMWSSDLLSDVCDTSCVTTTTLAWLWTSRLWGLFSASATAQISSDSPQIHGSITRSIKSDMWLQWQWGMFQMKFSRRNYFNLSCRTTLTTLSIEWYHILCSATNTQLVSIMQRWRFIFTQKHYKKLFPDTSHPASSQNLFWIFGQIHRDIPLLQNKQFLLLLCSVGIVFHFCVSRSTRE